MEIELDAGFDVGVFMVRLTRRRSSTSLSMEIISSSYLKYRRELRRFGWLRSRRVRSASRSQRRIHAPEFFEYEPFGHVFKSRTLAQLVHYGGSVAARSVVDARA